MPTLNRRKDNNTPSTHRQGQNNRAFYRSYRWQKYSEQYRKAHRLCTLCLKEGKTMVSECVDHIIPITQGGDKWDPANHQALCTAHHNTKTKHERSWKSPTNQVE